MRDQSRRPHRYVPDFVVVNPHVNPACVALLESADIQWIPSSLEWCNDQQRAFIKEWGLFGE